MVLRQITEEIWRAAWGAVLVFALCAAGVITIGASLSNALVDTGFYFIRISNEPVWVALLTPFGLRTGTWFTFCSMVVTSIISVIITVQLSAHLPGGARAYLRFGSFSWWLLPLLLVAPVLFAGPYLLLTRLFGIGPPIYFPTSYLDIATSTFLLSVMVPIREEIIWRGFFLSRVQSMGFGGGAVALLSAGIFSILHLPHEVGILKAIAVFPGGLLLAYVRLRTGGVFWPIILHGLANTAELVDWSKLPF